VWFSHHHPLAAREALTLPLLGFFQTLQIYLIEVYMLCHWLEFLICDRVNLLVFAAVCYFAFVGKPLVAGDIFYLVISLEVQLEVRMVE